MVLTKFKTWKYVHVLLWLLWAIVTVFFYRRTNAEEFFNLLFGNYFSYGFFYWFELVFMFGGGLLLLLLLSKLLPDRLIYLSYIFFELLFIGIVTVKLMVVFY